MQTIDLDDFETAGIAGTVQELELCGVSHRNIQVDLRPKSECSGASENPVASKPQRMASRA